MLDLIRGINCWFIEILAEIGMNVKPLQLSSTRYRYQGELGVDGVGVLELDDTTKIG